MFGSASLTTFTYCIIASVFFMPFNSSHAVHLLLPTKSKTWGHFVLLSPIVACLYNPYIFNLTLLSVTFLDYFMSSDDILNNYYRISYGIYYYYGFPYYFYPVAYCDGFYYLIYAYYFLNIDFHVFLMKFIRFKILYNNL